MGRVNAVSACSAGALAGRGRACSGLRAAGVADGERWLDTGRDMTSTLDDITVQIDRVLARSLPDGDPGAARLAEAARYALLAPGKRVRAIVTLLAAEHCGGRADAAAGAAAAIEMVHAASLVLDDLPAMDDATLRRGRAATHRAFGEDTAILAAIALVSRAFGTVAEDTALSTDARIAMTQVLARSIGLDGLTAGQERDLKAGARAGTSVADVERTHELKTGELFAAAAECGAIAAGATSAVCSQLRQFGLEVGLAFQGYDDLIDVLGSALGAGKDVGRDLGKPTVAALMGPAEAEAIASEHMARALAALDRAGPLDSRLRQYVGGLRARLLAGLGAVQGTRAVGT